MVTEMQKPLETEINAYEQRRAELERITCENGWSSASGYSNVKEMVPRGRIELPTLRLSGQPSFVAL